VLVTCQIISRMQPRTIFVRHCRHTRCKLTDFWLALILRDSRCFYTFQKVTQMRLSWSVTGRASTDRHCVRYKLFVLTVYYNIVLLLPAAKMLNIAISFHYMKTFSPATTRIDYSLLLSPPVSADTRTPIRTELATPIRPYHAYDTLYNSINGELV